ncbi:MAG: ABC transporter permease [Dehalococcoidia bacterium]
MKPAETVVTSAPPSRLRFPWDRALADSLVVLLLLGWYLASLRTPEYILANPVDVLRRTGELFFDPSLFVHTYISLARVVGAVVLAQVIGMLLVTLSYYVPVTRTFVNGRITPLLNAFPTLGWAIAAIFWFGVSTTTVIFVEVAILLPFCIINLDAGFRSLNDETLEMARSFTRSPWRVLRLVVLPLLHPYLLSSVRVSYGVAWKVALIAELFGATTGLGYLLNFARTQFDSTTIFATILAIILLVFVIDRLLLDRVERRTLRYKSQTAPVT